MTDQARTDVLKCIAKFTGDQSFVASCELLDDDILFLVAEACNETYKNVCKELGIKDTPDPDTGSGQA